MLEAHRTGQGNTVLRLALRYKFLDSCGTTGFKVEKQRTSNENNIDAKLVEVEVDYFRIHRLIVVKDGDSLATLLLSRSRKIDCTSGGRRKVLYKGR